MTPSSNNEKLTSTSIAVVLRYVAEQERKRLLGDFYAFCVEIMGFDLEEQPHREMCTMLQGLVEQQGASSEQTKGLLLVPRGSFKSSLASVALPIWLLAKNPNLRILLTCHVHELAKAFLQEIKTRLQMDEKLKTFVGDWFTGAPEWSEHGIIITARTIPSREPSIDTAGTNKAKVGGHYEVILADDIQTDKNTTTESQLVGARRYLSLLFPILDPGGVLCVIGTRWHHQDVYGHLLRAEEQRREKQKPAEWVSVVHGCYLESGQLFFPARLTERFLDQQKRTLTDRDFACQYLNRPIEEGSEIFPKAWYKYFEGEIDTFPFQTLTLDKDTANEKKEGMFPVYVTMALDPAYSSARRSDYAGITIVAFDDNMHWWVLEADRVRGGPVPVLDRLVYWARRYNIRQMACETVAHQELYRTAIIDRFKAENMNLGVFAYKEALRRTKEKRIEALQPLFKQGKIHLKRGLSDLYRELEDWPQTEHDDLLDSLAQHFAIARKPGDVWSAVQQEFDDAEPSDQELRKRTKYGEPTIGLSTQRLR